MPLRDLALIIVVCLAWAFNFIAGARGMLNFQAWTAVITLPVMLTASLFTEHNQLEMIRTAQWLDWSTIFYSAMVASIIGHGLFFHLVQRHPVTAIMPYLQLMPLFGIVFGTLVWGDRPGWRLYIGGVVVLLGILIITLRARKKTVLQKAS